MYKQNQKFETEKSNYCIYLHKKWPSWPNPLEILIFTLMSSYNSLRHSVDITMTPTRFINSNNPHVDAVFKLTRAEILNIILGFIVVLLLLN